MAKKESGFLLMLSGIFLLFLVYNLTSKKKKKDSKSTNAVISAISKPTIIPSASYNIFAGEWQNMRDGSKKCAEGNMYVSATRCAKNSMKDIDYGANGELVCVDTINKYGNVVRNDAITEHLCSSTPVNIQPHMFSKVYLFSKGDLNPEYAKDFRSARDSFIRNN